MGRNSLLCYLSKCSKLKSKLKKGRKGTLVLLFFQTKAKVSSR